MFLLRKALIIALVLLGFGLALQPFDHALRKEMEQEGLLYPPLDLDTKEAIGQVSLAISLGGLRSLVASIMNLTVASDWEKQEWFEIEKKCRTIVVLQPKTRYYWQNAAWHLASNAWADYEDKPGLAEAQRRLRQRAFLDKGIEFLQHGVENNPQDSKLWFDLAYLYENPHRPPNDLPASAKAYEGALACENAHSMLTRRLFYVLARIPERQADAYRMSKDLLAHPDHSRVTSVRTQSWALQERFASAEDKKSLEEIFGSRFAGLENLSYYWIRRSQGFPMDGVRETIDALLLEFENPARFGSHREALLRQSRYWINHRRSEIPMDGMRASVINLLEEFQRPEAFNSRWEALETLTVLYRRIDKANHVRSLPANERIPLEGIRNTLVFLLKEFQVPEADNPLRERGPNEPPWNGYPEELRPTPPTP